MLGVHSLHGVCVCVCECVCVISPSWACSFFWLLVLCEAFQLGPNELYRESGHMHRRQTTSVNTLRPLSLQAHVNVGITV